MIWPLAGALVLATTAPHLLPSSRLTPASGVFLWLAVLAVRALLVALLALALILYLPTTQLFQLLTHWCFHAVIPFMATHLGFSAHSVGDAATLIPSVAIAASLVSALFAIWRSGRSVRRWLRRSSLGPGPADSVIVGGPDVMLAATGIRRPQVVVSTGALATLDDAELAAGLEHEHGHIARCHPYLATAAELMFAIARPLPGSREALTQLHFHLERDADEFAIRRTGDPLALASVICKAAGAPPSEPALIGLANTGAPARLRLLMNRSASGPSRLAVLGARGLATVLAALALLMAVSTPAITISGFHSLQSHAPALGCDA
jgi:Peptidase family M48